MTAFVPMPARRAVELLEAAGIPEAKRLLIDSAAAELVKAYALAIETVDTSGERKLNRGPTIPIDLWRRVVKAGVGDEVWSGGTVRLAGSDLRGGEPEVNITGVGFGKRHLLRLIEQHDGLFVTNGRARRSAAAADVEASNVVIRAGTKRRRSANPSAIPAGAITVTVQQTVDATGLGRTTIDKLMRSGTLERKKVGSRTLITVASIVALLEDKLAG